MTLNMTPEEKAALYDWAIFSSSPIFDGWKKEDRFLFFNFKLPMILAEEEAKSEVETELDNIQLKIYHWERQKLLKENSSDEKKKEIEKKLVDLKNHQKELEAHLPFGSPYRGW